MNSNFEFKPQPSQVKPLVSHSEMKLKVLITDIEKRLDKNSKDYWIIRGQLDKHTRKSFIAFSEDYNLDHRTKSILINSIHHVVNKWAVLTIKKMKDEKEKVINLEIEKE